MSLKFWKACGTVDPLWLRGRLKDVWKGRYGGECVSGVFAGADLAKVDTWVCGSTLYSVVNYLCSARYTVHTRHWLSM